MKEKASRLAVLTKGIIKENPNLVLLLGTCPTLATTSVSYTHLDVYKRQVLERLSGRQYCCLFFGESLITMER